MSECDRLEVQALQDGIMDIQCNTVSQSVMVPQCVAVEHSLDGEVAAAREALRAEQAAAFALAQHKGSCAVRLARQQQQARQAAAERAAGRERAARRQLRLLTVDQDMLHMMCEFEDSSKLFAELFRSAPEHNAAASVQRKITAARERALQMCAEIDELKRAVCELRARFTRPPHPALLADRHTPRQLCDVAGESALERESRAAARLCEDLRKRAAGARDK